MKGTICKKRKCMLVFVTVVMILVGGVPDTGMSISAETAKSGSMEITSDSQKISASYDSKGKLQKPEDTEAPELTAVTVDGISVAAGGPFYYNETKKVRLEINERFFAEAIEHGAAPVIEIWSRNNAEKNFEKNEILSNAANAVKWETAEDITKSGSGEYKNTAEIELPVVNGEDTEYQIKVKFKDTSGNAMINGDGIPGVMNGEYTSQTFLFSNRKPELTAYSVSGITDRKINGTDVYHMGENGKEDVTLAFSIKDNDTYWFDELISENLTLAIYNLSVDSDTPGIIRKGDQLDWTAEGNIHKATYSFSGEEKPANYRVTVTYTNPFGNSMKLADTFDDGTEESYFDETQGVYTSAEFILDHKNPLYTVSYNEAYRLVKDGEGNTGAVNDRMKETPLTGYTAYYNDDIDVCFTVEEDYAIASEAGELHSDFELSIVQDGIEMAVQPSVSWNGAEGVYTGEFTLSEEGTYEITMKYRDAAGNPMEAGSQVMGSRTDTEISSDGVYTSTTLVLDRTAPEIILDYVAQNGRKLEPAAVMGEQDRKYFNENVYLRVEVKDKNIRYIEFKEALLNGENLSVCDVLGNKLEDNSVTAFLNQESFAPDTVSHDGVIWDIPLFFRNRENYGANYGFTIGYEDLAGNGKKEGDLSNTVTTYAAFDKTLPEQDVYICFASDTAGSNSQNAELTKSVDKGWMSKALDFLSDKWLNIFGKEKINFMIYLRDLTVGIDSVSMQYRKDKNSTVSFGTAGRKTSEAEIKISQSEKERKNENFLAGYMVLEGSITVSSGQDAEIDKFSITEIKDKAGNIRSADDSGSDYILHNMDSETNLLYLDCTAPVLDIDYTETSVTDEENGETRIFYKDTAALSYMLTERFFQVNTDNGKDSGKPIEPTVTVEGENHEKVEISGWTADTSQNYDALATVKFPAAANGETEYKYTVAYEDAAGNFVKAGETCKGTAVNGVYTDYTIIVDNLAPKLTMFEIQGDTDRTVDSVPVYHNDGSAEQNDVIIAFTVDDNTSYWNPSALIFEIYNTSAGNTEPCVRLAGSALEWKTNGRLHSTAYGFDGENETPADYYVKIRYADRAGNDMVSGSTSVNAGQFLDGTYTSSHFILDHMAPVFNIRYNEAVRVVNQDTSIIKDSDAKTPQTGYTSYYNKQIDVEFSIAEHYAMTEGSRIVNQKEDKDFILSVIKDGARMEASDMPEVIWTKTVTDGIPLYKARFTLNYDGRYQISVSFRDAAMNKMEAGNVVQGSDTAEAVTADGAYGTYTSTLLVLDSHAPEVSFAYIDVASKNEVKPQNIFENTERNYFNQSVYLQIRVDDTVSGAAGTGNIRYQELKNALTLKAVDSGGKRFNNTKAQLAINGINLAKAEKDAFVIELPMTDEANYDMLLEGFEDLAGNKVSAMTTKACVDSTKPEVTLSCKLSDNSGFSDSAVYGKRDIWFADSTLLVTAVVIDAVAGVQEIEFTVSDTDDDGKTLYRTQIYNPPETVNWKKKQTFTVPIPLETADFNGTVTAAVSDWSNNAVKAKQESIIESQKRHDKTASAEIRTKTKPSRVVDNVNYYNTDVKFTFAMGDSYSGIRDYTIIPGKDPAVSQNFAKEKASNICHSYQENVTLSSKNNNANGVSVTAKYTDNTNHSESVEEKYNIDVTAPVIDVTYNLNNPASERYYKDTRIATVTITERNFDPRDVEFRISNSEGIQPAISGWSKSGTGDATRNICTITYSADGDYTFSVAFQDKAGNRASYNRVDEFTIDQTKPTYTVTYDNNDYENEHYYKKERTATIDILEHNFDPSGIKVSVTKNGVAADVQLSGWSSNGDHNIASVPFHTDGEYTFTISGMDLAQNDMEAYTEDHFVVDMTPPNLEIQNIEHMSANNDVVAPRIVYSDTNYDESRTEIIYEGYNNGKVDYSANGVISRSSEGAVIEMNDVERIQENDDIYTMKVTVYDKAGNSSEAEKIFSVNRFGSVYTFEDTKTGTLIGSKSPGYTNTAQDIRVKETNVDFLKKKEITCNRDGELLPMKEGVQYGVTKSGSDVTWKQYTYTLYKDNFEEEGHYTIKILSEDRAANVSDNDTKGKKIEFVMDITAPSALVSGVEENGRYQTSSQDVTVDVEDNILLGRVQLYVNDKMVADYENMKELMELNGMINYSIAEQNYAQSFKVVATDAAGNDYTEEISNFTVNTSRWKLFLANKPLVYGILIALFTLAAFFWFLILAKKTDG